MTLSSCDENRLRLIAKIESSFARAKKLEQAGELEKALEEYLFAFDNGHLVPGWGGVRLSYVPSAIARLGERLPAATLALSHIRDAREKLIRSGELEFDVIHEWLALNRYLNEHERELQLLRELKDTGTLDADLESQIIRENYERLLEAGEYKILDAYFDKFGAHFLQSLLNFDCDTLLPPRRKSRGRSKEMAALWSRSIKKDGRNLYELALATKRWDHADEVARRVLSYCPEAESLTLLAETARRLKRKTRLKKLCNMAEELLPADELKKMQRDCLIS